MNATTAAEVIPTVAGTLFAGGIYAGRFFVGAEAFALVVSPKVDGEVAEIAWNKSRKSIERATSYADGRANTEAMLAAGSKLAETIRALRIGGHDDWYLPSRLESLVAFGELKGNPAFDFEFDWYWTSTQNASDPACAWCQNFGYGTQHDTHKGYRCRARAVRRVPIR
jgi:hypothetical protein